MYGFHAGGRRDVWESGEEKRLILSSGMKAQMCCRVQMTLVLVDGTLMRLKVGSGIQREHLMLMIELMREDLAIERPAKRICQHADQQREYDRIGMKALTHGSEILYPCEG